MTEQPTTILLYGTATDSIVDGPGLRFAIFTQGCPHHCKGCHNPESQAFEGGYEKNIDELVEEIKANQIIQGVTLSGGEPLAQSEAVLVLARKLKAEGFDLWLYSGYLYEQIIDGSLGPAAQELLSVCDVLVDGPFVQDLHHYELTWKGSSNQRVIDIEKSLNTKKVTLWESYANFPKIPSSW